MAAKDKCTIYRAKTPDCKASKVVGVKPDVYDQLQDIAAETSLGLRKVADVLLRFALERLEIKDEEE